MAEKEEINPNPLEQDFYKMKGWRRTIVEFYCDKKNLLPKDALIRPVDNLTEAINNVLIINKNWPQDSYNLFRQAVGPLWDPDEYIEKIYDSFKRRAKDENEPRLDIIAESLFYIRRIFEQDKDYIMKSFSREIKNNKLDLVDYSKNLQNIIKTHTNQVIRMLRER